jgi:hypothetical protein
MASKDVAVKYAVSRAVGENDLRTAALVAVRRLDDSSLNLGVL